MTKPVAAVRIEGTETIPEAVLLQKVAVRVGRPTTDAQIRNDVKRLYATKWFAYVERAVRDSPDGPVVVYTVKELPILGGVQYLGNDKISDEQLSRVTGLKPGSPYRVTFNRDAAEQIRRFYVEKGYRRAKVTLERGAEDGDRAVVFRIVEGPKVRVAHVDIRGNRAFGTARSEAQPGDEGLAADRPDARPARLPPDAAAAVLRPVRPEHRPAGRGDADGLLQGPRLLRRAGPRRTAGERRRRQSLRHVRDRGGHPVPRPGRDPRRERQNPGRGAAPPVGGGRVRRGAGGRLRPDRGPRPRSSAPATTTTPGCCGRTSTA